MSKKNGSPYNVLLIVAVVVSIVGLRYAGITAVQPLQFVLGLVSVLFAPGYITVLAIVQLSGSPSSPTGPVTDRWLQSSLKEPVEFETIERGVLSVLASVVIVPVIGLFLSFVSVRISPSTIVFSVGGYTFILALLTLLHRALTGERQNLFGSASSAIRQVTNPPTNVDTLLNLGIVALLVVGGLVMIAPVPGQHAPQFTEFYVLAEDEDEPAMEKYLSTMDSNTTQRLWTGISNREHRPVGYTVVVQVQQVDVTNRSMRVIERERVGEFETRLDHNESVRVPYELTTTEADTGCRVAFLLYRGEVPASPTVANAYRELHLWHATNPPPSAPSCRDTGAISVRINRSAVSG